MPEKQIFYDPQRKRWKRLRRILDAAAVVLTIVLGGVIFNSLRGLPLPELLLPSLRHNYKALNDRTPLLKGARPGAPARRKSDRKPSDIPLNTGEGLRAAYYVPDDATSYSSFKQHIHQIDMLFPEWLHVNAPEPELLAVGSDFREYRVIDGKTVHDPDDLNKIKRVIQATREDTEVFPHVNNYNEQTQQWDPAIGDMLGDPGKRAALRQQMVRFLTAMPAYRGLSLDFENLNAPAVPAYMAFIQELYGDLHPRNLRLYVNAPVSLQDQFFKQLAANSDGIILMNYDQHELDSDPGPIAAQDWFLGNLQHVLKIVPKEKLICAIGNYGYDWSMSIPAAPKRGKQPAKPRVLNTDDLSISDVWQRASDAGADLDLDYDTLNPHFQYIDEDNNVRHVVWFLDAVTVLNEMRGARQLGLQTFALWRLGEEDSSLWNIWDKPSNPDSLHALGTVEPGHDVDTEGDGEIIRVTGLPKAGKRIAEIDTDEPDPRKKLIVDEHMDVYPSQYTIRQYGYQPNKVAISFDDGPDPKWTPRILDVLKSKGVHGTFMLIGEEAQQNMGLMQRIVDEGNEIGNHTFTHPDISEISQRQLDLEVKLTSRLFASRLGIQPLYFRPPYDIDEEPETDDQAAPVVHIQQMGFTVVGNKIDTNDWDERIRKTPAEIAQSVLDQLNRMKVKPQFRGSIILMHDGGGDRSVTVAALPVLIDTLRAHGYEIVNVSALMGKTTAAVMPRLTFWQRVRTLPDLAAFTVLSAILNFVVLVFFLGDILMCARLILVGLFAIIDRLRRPHKNATAGFNPRVAVLIPAYNEEKVIVRTIRSVLNSDYANLRVIVIDDGSRDATAEVAREAYAAEIAAGRVTVLEKPNGGKAAALNFALNFVEEEFYVGIDADTVIAADAVSKLIPHFEDARIGAVAGNAKVGNRVNLWTRWQALEYITSQNFERRALDLFHVVTVVPGAIGAWRTEPVKNAGGYPENTVAEDADLTMSLLEQGLRVDYEDRALAFTEAPIDAKGLMRQRFRWSFGTLQAIWKHRAAFTKNAAMGFFALPNILIFQMLLPLVSPFIDIMFAYGILHYFIDRHYHPEAASSASFMKLVVYFTAFLLIDFVTSAVAFSLERRHPANKGDGWLLFHIWLQRFSYRQLFSVVLFKTLRRAIDGKPFSWDKLERTAKMSKQTEALTETR